MLDLNRLRVLREVGRQGSFSAAAAALAYTQPAISRQIATLEREIGARLVERNPRGVRLTDAGAALVAHTEAILARLADAEAEVKAIGELRGGRLRMASFPTAAATLAPLAIAAFRRAHPEVTLSLTMAEPADALPMLICGELDIALSLDGVDANASAGIERLWLFDDPMYIALPAEHPLSRRRRIRLADFRDEEWMLGTSHRCPDARLFAAACREAGFDPKLTFENDDYAAIAGFVAAGVGIAMIPDLAATSVRDDIVLRSLGPGGPVRRIVAATKAGGYRSPAARAML
ncbi:MAG: LysR family transcriptional regulator, partial [Actinobacteria bacterium]|nr:LysR family transcriptional regulator [Actinomycetota bacterium]